jgi:hypothetical protein
MEELPLQLSENVVGDGRRTKDVSPEAEEHPMLEAAAKKSE